VERDGSAYFRVPARTPVMFQALDAQGRAVQTMRSLTYLQPGEQVSCVGCHEPRSSTSPGGREALAMAREPSTITPGPDGSRPLSYPILVQPVLDRHCVACHNAKKAEGKVVLTGKPAGKFSESYNALVTRVSYTAWGNPQNNFEPLTSPDRFGARASKLVALLDRGHYDVKLSADEWERIVTWIDANALFYGTFNPDDQARQLRGERIAGPGLE
jgi:mono/diheme cytochrome c family protein